MAALHCSIFHNYRCDRSRIYHHLSGDGVIVLNDTSVHTVRIIINDAYLNSSTLEFKLQYDDNLAKLVPPHVPHAQYNPNFVNTLDQDDFELYLPETVLCDTIQPVYSRSETGLKDAVSANHIFCDASIPPGDYFSVRIRPNKSFPSIWGNKVLIKNVYGKRTTVKKAEWQNEWLAAEFDDFGSYQAFVDVDPPAINAPGRGDTIDLSGACKNCIYPNG